MVLGAGAVLNKQDKFKGLQDVGVSVFRSVREADTGFKTQFIPVALGPGWKALPTSVAAQVAGEVLRASVGSLPFPNSSFRDIL